MPQSQNLFADKTDLELLTLDLLCIKHFGPKYLLWEYETIKQEIQDDFGDLGDTSWQSIQAAVLLHNSSSCWSEWEVFEKVVAAINGIPVIFTHTQPPSPEELAVAIHVMSNVADHTFSEEVCSYIGAACLTDGLWFLEAPLNIASKSIGDLDKRKNLQRDYESVHVFLEKKKKIPEGIVTMAEAQARRVISVRNALKEYNGKMARELSTYQSYLQGN